MTREIQDKAVAMAVAIANEMKALDKEAPVIPSTTRRKGRLELPSLREASLREAIAEVYGQGTAHNNNN